MTWDFAIHRALLIDGSGSQGTIADLALAAGRIAGIGPSLPGDAISDQVPRGRQLLALRVLGRSFYIVPGIGGIPDEG